MKNIPTWIKFFFIIGILIASKYIFFSKKEDKPLDASKKKMSAPVAVNYFVTSFEKFSKTIFTTGKIVSFNQVEIYSEVNGKVTDIYFKEGETVSKGDLLIKLNDADLQAQLLKTKSQLKLAEQKLERLKKLVSVNGVSQEEIDVQENELNVFKADLAFYLAQISKTTITAPFSGALGLKNISIGSYVNTGSPIVSLVQENPLFVEFSVPEKYNTLLKKGLVVNFSNDNLQGIKNYSASIYAIEPRIDESSKTIKARALINGNHKLYAGSFVKVFMNLNQTENTILVPTQAVIPTLKGHKVIVSKNGIATDVFVTIGLRTDERIQILEGLNTGDTVITTGLLSIRKESKLKLLKAVN